jgi:preprotein translocase subunit YajC
MIQSILLQQPASGGGGSMVQMLFLVGMFVVMYIFMVLPQRRKQKKQQQFLQSLSKGDSVVTAGGIHGKIVSVEEHTVTLEVDRGIKIKFEKGSISSENSEALKEASKKAAEKSEAKA